MIHKLSDLCTFVDERIAVADLNIDNYISTENMLPNKDGITHSAGLPTVPQTVAYKIDDVLVSNIRPYFKKIWFADRDGGCSNDVLVFRVKDNCVSKFLYYLLADDKFFDYATATAKGTKMPRGDKDSIMRYTIPYLPDIPTQRSITAILSCLDDKIALNTKINHHLEQMAQVLFKSWFVDFEPWGGVMPKDWQEGTLDNILQSIKQPIKAGEFPELPYVPIEMIPMNSLALTNFLPNEEAQSSLITFAKNDILIGAMRVYFHRVSIAPFDGITRTTCFVLRPRNKTYLEYALLLCNEDSTIDYAQNTSKGSTMPYAVWDNGLANLPIVIPTLETAQEFSNILRPIIKRLRNSLFENLNLITLRDSLLPRLMSGELSVSDIDKCSDM